MTVNKEEFFREMTLRMSSSLDINIVLKLVLEYLQRFMPLNQVHLSYAADGQLAESNTSNCVALANDGMYPDIRCHASQPSKIQQWVLKQKRPFMDKDILVVNDCQHIASGPDSASSLIVPLRIDTKLIGFLWLWAMGENRFNADHADLLESVAAPFALALSNVNSYASLLKNRETIIDDNRFLNNELLSQAEGRIIGASMGLRDVMILVQQVARQNTTVLIVGETGTGKEGIANAIHFASPRKDGPFIKINCGAIAENLIDDELFGHEKGAFTGATSEKRGRFERANGGTFFLDEIGELPLQSQVRLLRVLQNKVISRVGGEKPIPVDVRIIAATNRDLKQMVAEGRFREDLWFRLEVFPISIPPLRQRKEDIPALIRHFVTQKSKELNIAPSPAVAPGAYERLMSYGWPGNVRELENMVERELIRYQGGLLRFDCLLLEEKCREAAAVSNNIETSTRPLSLDEAMCLHIRNVLKMTNNKIHGAGGAAELLGINPSTLRGRMRNLGILHGTRNAKRTK